MRGPDGATLGDVVEQLTQLNSIFETMSTNVTQIRDDMRRLMGDPPNSSGFISLPEELSLLKEVYVFFATYFPSVLGSQPIDGNAGAIRDMLVTIRNSVGLGAQSPASLMLNMQGTRNDVADLITKIDTLGLVMGRINDSPQDQTLKSLLNIIVSETRRAADCCEGEAPGGGGGTPLPPDDVCPPAAGGAQATNWYERGTTIINFQERQVRIPEFPANLTPFGKAITGQPGGNWYYLQMPGDNQATLTISWDYSGETNPDNKPVAFTLISAVNSEPDFSNWAAVEPVTLGDMEKGCSTYDINECGAGPDNYYTYYIAFAFPLAASNPLLNVWLTVDDIGCAS
jgi:hypothetical protein